MPGKYFIVLFCTMYFLMTNLRAEDLTIIKTDNNKQLPSTSQTTASAPMQTETPNTIQGKNAAGQKETTIIDENGSLKMLNSAPKVEGAQSNPSTKENIANQNPWVNQNTNVEMQTSTNNQTTSTQAK